MRSFQLDQNSNHKRLAERCNAEGRCFVKCLPKQLIDEDDHVVLKTLLGNDATLLTMDFRIVDENPSCIPSKNPGLIVVMARPNTAERMSKILAQFKSKFPQWAEFDWSQIHVQIEDSSVSVSSLVDAQADDWRTISYERENFASALTDAIGALKIRP